jgi:hypothetical protein
MAARLLSFALPLAMACAAAGLGCGTPRSGPVHLAPSTELSWEDAVRESTRRTEPYDHTLRLADLRATLMTPRMRTAFAHDRERFHGRFTRDLHAELIALGQKPDEGVDAPMMKGPEGEEQMLVFASLYVSDSKHRELQIRQTIWDTELVRGNVRVKAIAIEPVRGSPAVSALFPYVDRFDEHYLLRFPLVDAASGQSMLTPSAEPLRLEIRSAIAACVVEWTLED